MISLQPAPKQVQLPSATSINLPNNASIKILDYIDNTLAISPNGEYIVYVSSSSKRKQLFYRKIDHYGVIPIPGTEGARNPFFSVDGYWLGYYNEDEGKLMKIILPDGVPQEICSTLGSPVGITWGYNNTIVYGTFNSGLFSVLSDGSSHKQLTSLDTLIGERTHRLPRFIPKSDKLFLVIGDTNIRTYDNAQIAVYSLETGKKEILEEIKGSNPQYIPTGHIIYSRDGKLFGIRYDRSNLGQPFRILDGILTSSVYGSALFNYSLNGTFIYVQGGQEVFYDKIVWYDRNGNKISVQDSSRSFRAIQIAPDKNKLVLHMGGGSDYIEVYDLSKNRSKLLTPSGNNLYPLWSKDSETVYYYSSNKGGGIFASKYDGSRKPLQITINKHFQFPYSQTQNNKYIAVSEFNPESQYDIKIMDTNNSEFINYRNSTAQEISPIFSPDDKWIAFVSSDEFEKHFEVYISGFPDIGILEKISINGGVQPIWNPNGKELFYFEGGKLMATKVSLGKQFDYETPHELFELGFSMPWFGKSYDYCSEKDAFLIIIPEHDQNFSKINVITNFFEIVKQSDPEWNE